MGHKGKKKHDTAGSKGDPEPGSEAPAAKPGPAPARRRSDSVADPLGLFGSLGQIAFGGRSDSDAPPSLGGGVLDQAAGLLGGTGSPVRGLTDALGQVSRTAHDDAGKSSTAGDADAKTKKSKAGSKSARPLSVPVVDQLAAGLGLPSNPIADALDTVSNLAPVPVVDTLGESLRQATDLVNAPLRGVAGVLGLDPTRSVNSSDSLRRRGTRLIRISYDPKYQPRDVHPSFGRIIEELLPDEARILRFLGVAGTQPMIDVRTKTLFQVGSVLLVGDLSMVAQMAGCHWADRDGNYFANLHRLGLVELSDEPVDDYRRYALLEVQPIAVEAIESVRKAVTVFRSIHLTPFGKQFIDVCFDTEGYAGGGWATDGRQDRYIGKGPRTDRPLAAAH
ncbi:hypothetical protein GCM10023147_02990 [Tsukamurella soli]|uniref:DUF4393 domain-containing protein n=2 Tax=Tsukamurella soli TaxID=644556 RepID=A0ABP8J253_9ACTN